MASKTASLKDAGKSLGDMVHQLSIDTENAHKRAVRKAAIRVFSNIIKMTPVDTGRARANWFVDTKLHNDTSNSVTPLSATEIASGIPAKMESSVYLFNNLPYIEAIEYGGYPNPPAKGSRQKDGSYKIKSQNGFSKQAPRGMVRVSLAEWGDILKKQIDIEMAKL